MVDLLTLGAGSRAAPHAAHAARAAGARTGHETRMRRRRRRRARLSRAQRRFGDAACGPGRRGSSSSTSATCSRPRSRLLAEHVDGSGPRRPAAGADSAPQALGSSGSGRRSRRARRARRTAAPRAPVAAAKRCERVRKTGHGLLIAVGRARERLVHGHGQRSSRARRNVPTSRARNPVRGQRRAREQHARSQQLVQSLDARRRVHDVADRAVLVALLGADVAEQAARRTRARSASAGANRAAAR